MAAPYPPQGEQKQHTERPIKIYGEQYLDGAPLPVGAVIYPVEVYADGLPRVSTATATYTLTLTDWVISSRYSGKPIEVISADEFAERFGPSELAEGVPA